MKKFLLLILLLVSSISLYAQGRMPNTNNMRNEVAKRAAEYNKELQKQKEEKQGNSVRQNEATRRANQQINENRQQAVFLDNNFQSGDYMTGPSDTDLSSFSGIQNNANKPDRLSILECDGAVSTPAKLSEDKNEGLGLNATPVAQKANLEISRLESLLVLGGGDYENVERDIRKMFYEQTGCSVKMLAEMEKKPKSQLSANEKMILENYKQFSDSCYEHMRKSAVDDDGKRETDMAILAEDVYFDSKHIYTNPLNKDSVLTDYKKINTNTIPKDDPFYPVALELEKQTNEIANTGFMAAIYKNDKTGEYAISFQGTVAGNSVRTDVQVLEDKVTEQDKAALAIGNALAQLPDGYKVNLTGHSLGGRLASIAGLQSGMPTVTINAAGVSDANLKEMGLLNKKNSNNYHITAIVSADDILNTVQKIGEKVNVGPGTAIGDKKIIGTEKSIKKTKELLKDNALRTMMPIKAEIIISVKKGAEAHKSMNVASEMINANRQALKKWDNWWKIDEARNKSKNIQ